VQVEAEQAALHSSASATVTTTTTTTQWNKIELLDGMVVIEMVVHERCG
jgi:hypothetical protein